MASYFVIAPDGSKYGPADELTLQQWIAENRLLPTTMLEDVATSNRVAASAVPGLTFPTYSDPMVREPETPTQGHTMYQPGAQIGGGMPSGRPGTQTGPQTSQPWTQAPSNYYRPTSPGFDPGHIQRQDKTNGIIMMVIGGLQALGGIFLLVAASFANNPQLNTDARFSPATFAILAVPSLLIGIGGIAAGVGVAKGAKWGFVLAIVVYALSIVLIVFRGICCVIFSIYFLIYCINRLSGKRGPVPT
jgi:hypothetical protein